jgi:hypothetical protein
VRIAVLVLNFCRDLPDSKLENGAMLALMARATAEILLMIIGN